MKHSNELYAKAIASLDIGYSEKEAALVVQDRDIYPANYELMCHRVHKALCEKYEACEIVGMRSGSTVYSCGDIGFASGMMLEIQGEGDTNEEAIKNAAVDCYEKGNNDG